MSNSSQRFLFNSLYLFCIIAFFKSTMVQGFGHKYVTSIPIIKGHSNTNLVTLAATLCYQTRILLSRKHMFLHLSRKHVSQNNHRCKGSVRRGTTLLEVICFHITYLSPTVLIFKCFQHLNIALRMESSSKQCNNSKTDYCGPNYTLLIVESNG